MTGAQIVALCRTLPRSEQALVRDRVKFRVRGLVYVSISPDEASMGFGFPKLERDALITAEPEKFFLPRTSDLRFHWVCARLAAIDHPEMRELIIDAWSMVVPQKVLREFWNGHDSGLLPAVPDDAGNPAPRPQTYQSIGPDSSC